MFLRCVCALALGIATGGDPGRPVPGGDPGRPVLGVDLSSYLSTADLLWDWDASVGDPLAPSRWFQAAYVGNGLLGALVTGTEGANGSTPSLRIDVGRTDLWIRAQRQPIGWLTVAPFAAPLARVAMRLVLYNATLLVDFTLTNGDAVHFMLWINAADPAGPLGVLCLFVTTLTGGADPLIFSWTPDTSGNYANTTVASGSVDSTPWGTPTQYFTQGGPRDKNGDGGTYTTAFTNFNLDCGQTLVLAVASDQRTAATWSSRDAAVASVAMGVDASVEGLQAASAGWWAVFWGGSWLSFDAHSAPLVTALEQFAHVAGYRYASAARFAMHDLMGPWGPGGPGKYGTTYCLGPWCQYCWDMNQQVMLYLPTPSNRGALLARPALDMLPTALNNTWYAVFGSNAPAGTDNLLWWLAAVARYCAFHGDDDRALTQLLPALRSLLSNSGLKNSTSDGFLHVEGCLSPEYPMRRATDCSYDLAIFRWAAETALALATAGDPSDPLLPTYADIAARLAPLPVDSATGSYEVAAGLPFAVPHRHYSHLLGVYDLGLNEPPERMAASLDVWWNITCAGPQAHGPDYNGDDECRGFTQAAMAAMSNRLNRTEGALGNLTSYLRLVGLPNGMYGEEVYAGHPEEFSPVSESAYSAAASVYGMMLGSFTTGGAGTGLLFNATADGTWGVRVWPAAPWANASFFRLRAQGALLVSAVRVAGATAWVAVEADMLAAGGAAGATVPAFALEVGDWAALSAPLQVVSGGGVTVTPVAAAPGRWLVAGLRRGGAAGVAPGGTALPDFVVREVQGRNESEYNYWGSRFVYSGELP